MDSGAGAAGPEKCGARWSGGRSQEGAGARARSYSWFKGSSGPRAKLAWISVGPRAAW